MQGSVPEVATVQSPAQTQAEIQAQAQAKIQTQSQTEAQPPIQVPQKTPKTPRYRRTKQYHLYTPEQKATIAKYAAEHGNTKAANRFTKELGIIVPESTIRTFKKAYYAKLSEGKQPDEITEIPLRRRGRPRKDGVKREGPTPKAAGGARTDIMQIAETPGFLEMTGDLSLSTFSVSVLITTYSCLCHYNFNFFMYTSSFFVRI